jgi:hypothetical protein
MPATKSPRMSPEERTRRRNQIIFLVLSGFLILAMLLSLVNI